MICRSRPGQFTVTLTLVGRNGDGTRGACFSQSLFPHRPWTSSCTSAEPPAEFKLSRIQEPDMSALVVLVNADPRALRLLEALLSENGYLVAALDSFLEAREMLESVPPDLLVADIRLERFNGLQLAIRSHFEHPDVPVIVTHAQEDPVAEAEAKRYGVSFFAAPLENPTFLESVRSLVDSRR